MHSKVLPVDLVGRFGVGRRRAREVGFHLRRRMLPDGTVAQRLEIVHSVVEDPVPECPHGLPVFRVQGFFGACFGL